jgi:hypothetical protein
VTAELDLEAGFGRTPPDHAVGVDAVHRLAGQHAGLADRGAEEGGLALLTDARSSKILVDEGLQLVVRRHLVALAAFLVQAHPPALALGVGDDGADARKRIGHHADQRAIAQADDG